MTTFNLKFSFLDGKSTIIATKTVIAPTLPDAMDFMKKTYVGFESIDVEECKSGMKDDTLPNIFQKLKNEYKKTLARYQLFKNINDFMVSFNALGAGEKRKIYKVSFLTILGVLLLILTIVLPQ